MSTSSRRVRVPLRGPAWLLRPPTLLRAGGAVAMRGLDDDDGGRAPVGLHTSGIGSLAATDWGARIGAGECAGRRLAVVVAIHLNI